MFAIVATAAVVFTSLGLTNITSAASFSNELQGAYEYAYGIGITTQSSIDSANMYGNLLRAHMAKMMVAYAKEVKGMKADTSVKVNFTDIAGQSAELQGYIVEAAQMGLMGINSDGSVAAKFNPTGVVTRAEFGTVLDRVINGNANNGGTPYYAAHLSALKAAGVMTNIATPNANEVRGYVMLMMQRGSTGTTTPATCSTAENILACSIGVNCPAECQNTTPVVKAGSLNVSLDSSTAANGTQVPQAGTVKFAVVDFAAGSSDISLNTVTIKKVGLASIPGGTSVWFEANGLRISGKASFTSDGSAVISFAPSYVVKAGSTAKLDLYVSLNTTAGTDIQFTSNGIDSTAQDVNGGFSTPTLRTASYSVITGTIATLSSGPHSYNASTDAVELGAFSIANGWASDVRDASFKSITLRQNGTADLTNLSTITLVRNGVVVASNPVINGKDLTFQVNDTIKDGTTANYYIKGIVTTVQNNAGDTYNFYLRQTSDLNIVEASSSFRATIVNNISYLGTYTVNGGDLTFARDTSVALSNNYAAGSSNVILMQGTISAKNAVSLENISLPFTTSTGLDKLFSTIYLKVGTSTFTYSPISTDSVASFLGSATVNGTVAVQMYGTLKSTAPAATVKFGDMRLESFIGTNQYISNSNTVTSSIGSIPGVSVTVQGSALNVSKVDGLGDQTISQGMNGVTLYGITLSSNQGNPISLSNAVFAVNTNNFTGTNGLNNNAYLTLYVNGSAVASKTVQGSTVSFDSFNTTIDQTHPVTLQIKANLTDAFNSGSVQVSLSSINAVDTQSSQSVPASTLPLGAAFTIAAADATIAISDNNPQAQLLLSPSTAAQLLAFKVTAKNDNVTLYNVNLTGVNIAGLSNFKLTDASGTVIATATSNTTTAVTFTQIANAPAVAKDASATYYIAADVNSNTTITPVTLTLDSVTIKASNGTTKNIDTNITSKAHATAENTLVIAKAANVSKDITSSALRFTVTAAGKDKVVLTGLNVTSQLSAYTGYTTVRVYKDSIDTANLAFEGNIGASQTLAPVLANAKTSVDAQSTATYIVVVENAIGDGSAGNKDWSIKLNNVTFSDTLSASTYKNVASFPIVEVK